MKTVAIIQARMESTRLPGKVLKKIYDLPLLEHIVNRTMRARNVDEVVIATSTNRADDAIEQFACKRNINIFRGSQENVLERFVMCAEK